MINTWFKMNNLDIENGIQKIEFHLSPSLSEKTWIEVFIVTVIIIFWYLSSMISNNLNKEILDLFPYPFTLTIFQFASTTIYCLLLFQFSSNFQLQRISRERFMTWVLPLCISSVLAHLTTSISLQFIPVSFTHTIKSSSPFFALILSKYYGFKELYSIPLYFSLFLIMFGVCLSTFTEINFNLIGFGAAIISTLIFCWQNAYSKKVLVDQAMDHVNLLFYSSVTAFFVTLPLWLFTDLPQIVSAFYLNQFSFHWTNILFILILDGFCHFGQNISAFTFMSKVTPLTYSVFNTFKRIVVIVSSILYFGNSVSFWSGFGMSLATIGVILYNKVKYDLKVMHPK